MEKEKNKERIPQLRFPEFKNAPAWEQRKLGEVAEFSKGNGYSKSDLIPTGTPIILYGRLYTNYETIIDKVDTYVSPKENSVVSQGNEVIVPASGETAEDISRASVVKNSGVILGGDLNIIKVNDLISTPFLAITISNGRQQKELSKRAQGKSVVHIRNSDLKQVDLMSPSLPEQKAIGDFFSTLDRSIALHQRELENLKNRKKSLLQKMFPKNGESVPKIRFPEFKNAPAWEQRKLGEVAERFDNLRIPVSAQERSSGTTPYYGANGIQDYIDGYTHDGEYILIAEDGANDLKDYPIQYVNGKVWVNNHAHVVQGISDFIDNKFLLFAMKQINVEPFLVGGGRAKLNADILMKLLLTFPSLPEQQAIGDFFSTLDRSIALHQRKLEHLKLRKKALLQKMFP